VGGSKKEERHKPSERLGKYTLTAGEAVKNGGIGVLQLFRAVSCKDLECRRRQMSEGSKHKTIEVVYVKDGIK